MALANAYVEPMQPGVVMWPPTKPFMLHGSEWYVELCSADLECRTDEKLKLGSTLHANVE